MLLAALVAGVAMGCKDLLGALTVRLEAGDLGLLAGCTDALGDIAAVITYGVAGVEVIRHGAGLYALAVFAAITVASVAGTFVGTRAGHAICARLTKESP